MSDTPRTDADTDKHVGPYVDVEFARDLERECTAKDALIGRCREAMIAVKETCPADCDTTERFNRAWDLMLAALAATPESAASELAQLRAWKESALELERSWDIQKIGKLIGLKLGQNIRPAIEPAIVELLKDKAQLDWLGSSEATNSDVLNALYVETDARKAIDAAMKQNAQAQKGESP